MIYLIGNGIEIIFFDANIFILSASKRKTENNNISVQIFSFQ